MTRLSLVTPSSFLRYGSAHPGTARRPRTPRIRRRPAAPLPRRDDVRIPPRLGAC
ncbi:hypothetical protein [Herbidospora sp. NBRC 101105]|uniref:hypothetical protein n=1 Tax=Herbidospora sp. NBRC 101105 TaxID=3032195 RepID=UPI0024A0A7B2|nr:hypothetical protein [Herbidospora sp. NBRC 101105]GLX94607.1 hypothetical protein Hesp01_25570 [Herbidospora sp. NBRC 101105]